MWRGFFLGLTLWLVASAYGANPDSDAEITGKIPIRSGGTSATNATDARANLGAAASADPIFTGTATFAAVKGASRTVSTTTDMILATDCGRTILYTSNSAVTVTIPASIAPAAGTICAFQVIQGGSGIVAMNGSLVTPASLINNHSYTGTNGTAGSAIGINLTTVTGTATAYLTGDGA